MNTPAKRTLPPLPSLDYLRKDAKTRLAALKQRVPTARLADVQFTLAREYGFENWAELKAEVERRAASPLCVYARIRRAPAAPHYPARHRLDRQQDASADDEMDFQRDFLRAGAIMQTGFLFSALIGVALVLVVQQRPDLVQAMLQRINAPLVQMMKTQFPEGVR